MQLLVGRWDLRASCAFSSLTHSTRRETDRSVRCSPPPSAKLFVTIIVDVPVLQIVNIVRPSSLLSPLSLTRDPRSTD